MSAETSVRVRILQLGRRVLEHAGGPGLTVGAALEAVGLAAAEGLDLRVNGAPAEGGTVLRDGDVLTLIPRIKGGGDGDRSAHGRLGQGTAYSYSQGSLGW